MVLMNSVLLRGLPDTLVVPGVAHSETQVSHPTRSDQSTYKIIHPGCAQQQYRLLSGRSRARTSNHESGQQAASHREATAVLDRSIGIPDALVQPHPGPRARCEGFITKASLDFGSASEHLQDQTYGEIGTTCGRRSPEAEVEEEKVVSIVPTCLVL